MEKKRFRTEVHTFNILIQPISYIIQFSTQQIMNYDQIKSLNKANFVLRHFVDLSSKLLPILDHLNRIKNPDQSVRLNKIKIAQIYENYNFENSTSIILMDSNILELIQKTYNDITAPSKSRRIGQKNKMLAEFKKEHDRLSSKWTSVDLN